MKTYRCVPCSDASSGLSHGFFAVRDARGRTWVCRVQEPPGLAGSGWEGWAHQATITSIFAQLMGDALSSEKPFEDVERIMEKTVVIEANDASALPEALTRTRAAQE